MVHKKNNEINEINSLNFNLKSLIETLVKTI